MDLVDEVSLLLPEGVVKAAPSAPPGETGAGSFTRKSALFLTADEVKAILPVLTELAGEKQVTPERAERARVSVEAILTDEQKAEYRDFVDSRTSMGQGTGPGPGGMGGGGPSAPPGGGSGGPGGPGGAAGGPGRPDDAAILKSLVDALRARLEGLGS